VDPLLAADAMAFCGNNNTIIIDNDTSFARFLRLLRARGAMSLQIGRHEIYSPFRFSIALSDSSCFAIEQRSSIPNFLSGLLRSYNVRRNVAISANDIT